MIVKFKEKMLKSVTMNAVWPLSVIIQELKLEIPPGISQPIFSTLYNFREITLLNSLLLQTPYSDDLSFFIKNIQNRDTYPINDLQHHTKTKALFQGRIGYIELLFRGTIKSRKRVDWYNTDLKINISPVEPIPFSSRLFRMHGIDRSDFELVYYNEIGLPYSFETDLVTRLERTRTGSYYAMLIPTEKKERVQGKTFAGGIVNEKYRFIVSNEKVQESVLSIIQKFRGGNEEQIENGTPKPKSIPLSVRKQVWRVYNGNVGAAPCFMCGINITALDYECGHIHSKSTGGPNVVSNLLPICGTCNKAMGDVHLFEYAEEHYKGIKCRCFEIQLYLDWKKEKSVSSKK